MKILLPCPECQRPCLPPRQASESARLRCPHCGHMLNADSILVDGSQLVGAWEVVEDYGTGNVFSPFQEQNVFVSGAALGPTSQYEMREEGTAVPQSNEWETQLSSVTLDEPIDTEAEFQIATNLQSLETIDAENPDEFEALTLPDEMIGVSDEPWTSPIEPSLAPDDLMEVQRDNAFDPLPDNLSEASDENRLSDDMFEMEPEELSTAEASRSELDFSEVFVQDDANELERNGVEDLERNDPHDLELEEAIELHADEEEEFEAREDEELTIQSPATPIVIKPRTPQLLSPELLSNASSVLRTRRKSNPLGTLLSVVGGGMAAIPISILLMWYVLGKDPLDVGPIVANLVPAIVPQKFRGPPKSIAEKLPEMPPMVGPAFSDSNSSDSMKFPSIAGVPPVETAPVETAQPTEPPADLNSSSMASTAPTNNETIPQLSNRPAIDPPTMPPESPTVTAAVEPTRPATNTTESIGYVGTNSSLASDSKIQQSLAALEYAIRKFDKDAIEAAGVLFRALEAFAFELDAIPVTSPAHEEWRSKGTLACEAIIANTDMVMSFSQFMIDESAELFPGEGRNSEKQAIKIDVVKVSSVEKASGYDMWNISMRFQKTLGLRPLFVPHRLGANAEPDSRWLVVAVSEVDPESRQLSLRTLMAIPRK